MSTTKQKFPFLKKKQDQSPVPPSSDDITPNQSDKPKKKDLCFLKKASTKKREINEQQESDNNTKPELNTQFFNELLSITTDSQVEQSHPQPVLFNLMNQGQKEKITPIEEDTSVKSAAQSSSKQSFSFIKKRNEILSKDSPFDDTKNYESPMPSNTNPSIDDYEVKSMQSDKVSVSSSKKHPVSETTHDNIESPMKSNELSPKNHSIYLPPQPNDCPVTPDESVRAELEKQQNTTITSYKNHITKLHDIKLQLKSTQSELSSFHKQHEDLIQEEHIAIEANDFIKAENLEIIVKQLNEKIVNGNQLIHRLTKDLLIIREEELTIMTSSTKESDTLSINFAKLQTSIEKEMDAFNNNQITKHQSENVRLKKMKEKLQFLKNNLDNENNYINEEEEKLSKVIKAQSSETFDELEALNQEKEILNDEIEDLKRRLEEKENQIDILNNKIESKESEIDAIKSNYNHDFSKIDIKKKNYAENYKDYEEQDKNFLKKKKDYETLDNQYNNNLERMKNMIISYKNEMNTLLEEKIKTNNEYAIKRMLLEKETHLLDEINHMTGQIEKSQEILLSHKDNIQKLNVTNKHLESEISQIDFKIPALEIEKKTHAEAKKFKEAGRVSNELKASIEKKKTNQQTIIENNKQIEESFTIMNKSNSNIVNLIDKKNILFREMNIVKYKSLQNYLTTLNHYLTLGMNNDNLLEEISFTKEEIALLEEYSYIKEKCDEIDNNNKESIIKEQDYRNNTSSKEDILIQIEELNKDLQNALEKEDYDEADKVQVKLDNLNEELKLISD